MIESALIVGAAVAKAVAKVWVQGTIPGAISDSLIDIVKSKVSGRLEQREVVRQFEAIGDRVAASLEPLFEGSSLDEGDRQAVALAVEQAFRRAPIDAKVLARMSLDPRGLADYLRQADPNATRDFSTDATTLYNRMIDECASDVVDIASKLPSFTEHTLGEILQRQVDLQAVAAAVLEEVRRIRDDSVQANRDQQDAARFEEEYRRAVNRNLDYVDLYGVDVARVNRRQRLSVAYIGLFVDRRPQHQRSGASELSTRHPASAGGGHVHPSDGPPESDARDAPSRLATEELLGSSQRILILGEAGSGKSTLLRWIAINAAGQNFAGRLTERNASIPFLVRLRDYVGAELPTPEDFPRQLAKAIADEKPDLWVRDCLKSGRAVILVDGVDELPRHRRDEVRTWLKDIIGAHGAAQVVVTSRPSAVGEGWLGAEDFTETRLRPMELADIYTFIDHWHAAVSEELTDAEEREDLASLAARLKKEVGDTTPLRNLAALPLLCAALCALNRQRHRQLPTSRLDLYHAFCEMLLERREKEQGLDYLDYPKLPLRKKMVLLQHLAYWMMRNNQTTLSREQAIEQLDRMRTNLEITDDGSSIMQFLLERSGILREPSADSVDFLHRSLQEYLCARAVVDADDIGLLLKEATNDQWREVIILVAGLAPKSQRHRLFTGLIHGEKQYPILALIKRGGRVQSRQQELQMLAVSCLETVTDLDATLRQEVDRCVADIIPPVNMTEAKAIAAAREAAIPYLVYDPNYQEAEVAACVSALGQIGGDAALEALKAYQVDTRMEVIRELVRASAAFEQDTYYREVLAPIGMTVLALESVVSLKGVQHLTSLRRLTISRSRQVTDLAPLADLPHLTALTLNDLPGVTDLAPLAGLPHLTELTLGEMKKVDLGQLAVLPHLTRLKLEFATKVDLGQIARLTNLTELSLTYVTEADLSKLAGLPHLTKLFLQQKKVDLSQLAGLPHLTELSLACLEEADLGPLARLTNLTSLRLYSLEEVKDLTPLAHLTKLRVLVLDGLPKVRDLKPLKQLPVVQGSDLRLPLWIFDLKSGSVASS